MKSSRLLAFATLSFIATFGLRTLADEVKWKNIRIDGGSAPYVFVKQAVVKFAKENRIGVTVDQNGAVHGFECLKKKECQIGMGTAEPPDAERDVYLKTMLGWDGLTVIVSSDVAVNSLTTDQVSAIYNGKITNWKEVGGAEQPINVFQRDKSRGSKEFFDTAFKVKSEGLNQKELGSNEQVLNVMRRAKNSIAYIGYASAFSGLTANDYKILALNGVSPSKDTIANGKYPLRRGIYLFRLKELASEPTLERLVQSILAARAEVFPKVGFIEAKTN